MIFANKILSRALCVALALLLFIGIATVSYAEDGDFDIPIGDITNPTNPSDPPELGIIDSGDYGELTWVLHANGVLEITGTGEMPESQAPWYDDRGLVKTVQIGEGVTTVSGQAFYNCSRMDSVQLPQSLKSIGYGAFAGCSSLKEIAIPDSVTGIGMAAFGASGLTSIELPAEITDIQQRTFAQCSDLLSVTLKEGVKTVDVGAFAGCESLGSVYYYGDAAKWEQISIAAENSALVNAERFYNADEVLRGDMNGDREVSDADALYLLRHTLFSDRYPINQSGDVNGDGEVSDADALYLLRFTLFPGRYPLH